MTLLPAPIVDALPERLWWLGNIYRVFGRRLHFCVGGGGMRTVEMDGREIGRGQRPFRGFHDQASDDVAELLWRIDVGWIAAVALMLGVVSGAILSYVRSDRRHPPDA